MRPNTDYELADSVIEWIDKHAPGPPMLPWQRYVVRRGLETSGGRPWRQVAFLVSRQQGKTYLMQRVLLARVSMFGGAVLNTHPDVAQAGELLESMARELDSGYLRARSNGADWWMDAPNVKAMGAGRVWRARAQTRGAITGQGGVGFVFVDELQDARREVINRTIRPILSGARVANPQAWFSGTGERDESDVLRALREAGQDRAADTLWIEWSAPPGCATDDRDAWRWASPDWSQHREDSLAADLRQMPERDFRSEYLVQHDAQTTAWIDPGIVRWRGTGEPVGEPAAASLECDVTGRTWSAAVSDHSGHIQVHPPGRLDACCDWLRSVQPPILLAHPSVIARLPEDMPTARPLTPREMQAALSVLDERMRAGTVSWDHGPEVSRQFADAVMSHGDGGPKLVASRSRGDVSLLKVLAAVAWHTSQRREPVLV